MSRKEIKVDYETISPDCLITGQTLTKAIECLQAYQDAAVEKHGDTAFVEVDEAYKREPYGGEYFYIALTTYRLETIEEAEKRRGKKA